MGYIWVMNGMILQSVIETPEFIRQAKACMSNETREEFISFIAENPKAGSLITGTGGARKVRWQADAQSGKRGGVRIIYYYHDADMPIYLFTVYKKNQRDTLTDEEENMLQKIIKLIVKQYKGK